MKFRFCGDLDCPDWVLLELSILSTMVIFQFIKSYNNKSDPTTPLRKHKRSL